VAKRIGSWRVNPRRGDGESHRRGHRSSGEGQIGGPINCAHLP